MLLKVLPEAGGSGEASPLHPFTEPGSLSPEHGADGTCFPGPGWVSMQLCRPAWERLDAGKSGGLGWRGACGGTFA